MTAFAALIANISNATPAELAILENMVAAAYNMGGRGRKADAQRAIIRAERDRRTAAFWAAK